MSMVHIRLIRTNNTETVVVYDVESIDFSDKREWQKLGELRIIKSKSNYQFINSKLADENKILPPEFYLLSEKERQHKLAYKYSGYGAGAWAMCINHWANILISKNYYPEIFPENN